MCHLAAPVLSVGHRGTASAPMLRGGSGGPGGGSGGPGDGSGGPGHGNIEKSINPADVVS